MKYYKGRKREDVLPNEHIFAERYYDNDWQGHTTTIIDYEYRPIADSLLLEFSYTFALFRKSA